jgi:hypothetical protein
VNYRHYAETHSREYRTEWQRKWRKANPEKVLRLRARHRLLRMGAQQNCYLPARRVQRDAYGGIKP